MYARFDFMSKKTGRVLLSTLFDSPQDRLPSKDVASVLRTLAATKKKLESVFGKGLVRLSLDGYETSVFWALVLFRPITLREERRSVYDILLNGDPMELQKLDLGIVYEPKEGFLVLDWRDATHGVLEGIEKCPSWQAILRNAAKRAKENEVDEGYIKHCAESHSWVVPEWILQKMKFLRGSLWFRPSLQYADITVLDVQGIEVIRLEGEGKGTLNEAELLTAKNVKFVHHYTTADKREFRSAYHQHKLAARDKEKAKQRYEERKARQSLRRKGIEIPGSRKDWRRKEFDTENRQWYLASRVIGELPKYLGKGMRGKYPPLMSAEASEKRFEYVLNAYVSGELIETKWRRVHALLKELEKLLVNQRVPREFGNWLIWRDKGKHVPAYLARRDHGRPAAT
jgi:hypothetical protein